MANEVLRDPERQRHERAVGMGLTFLGGLLAVVTLASYQSTDDLRSPSLWGALVLILLGILTIDRAGLPRAQNAGGRRAFGIIPLIFGILLAFRALDAADSLSALMDPLVLLAYAIGVVMFGVGGWFWLRSPSSTVTAGTTSSAPPTAAPAQDPAPGGNGSGTVFDTDDPGASGGDLANVGSSSGGANNDPNDD